MKPYTIACTAQSWNDNALIITTMCGLVFADGQDEATGKALRMCRESMPENNGYSNHAVAVSKIPQNTINTIQSKIKPTDDMHNLALWLMLALVDEVRHSKDPSEATLAVLAKAQAEFGCECGFVNPYGWVVSADCEYHD